MDYLTEYKNQRHFKSRGLRRILLNHLDKKWQKRGEKNRFAYLLQRAIDVCQLSKRSPLSVLEVGGGDGLFFTLDYPKLHKTIVDIEDSYEKELVASGINFYKHDMSQAKILNIADESCDMVAMNHLIEHITNIEFFMEEINRILKPDGKIYIRTPDIKKVRFAFYDDCTHVRPFSKTGLSHLMRCYGFEKLYSQSSNSSLIQLDNLLGFNVSKALRLGKEIEAVFQRAT